ncbi:MAG: ABC transporter substrate-binding protein [Halobacteriovoraceae bacterium]|nr:ABC transporter substrate-binding protein [Halobacteriovoraceae bacterium]
MKLILYSLIYLFGINAFAKVIKSHAFSVIGFPKYRNDFKYIEHVNPSAPKNGEIILSEIGTFNTFNPLSWIDFSKYNSAAGVYSNIFQRLLINSFDEPSTYYGLLAESIEYPDNYSYLRINLRKEARFMTVNPDPNEDYDVTALDVSFSYETIKKSHHWYENIFKKVSSVDIINEKTIQFNFNVSGQEGKDIFPYLFTLSIFKKSFYEKNPLSSIGLNIKPIGSGPYYIDNFDENVYITFKRFDNYWADKLPIFKGRFNFKKITYQYYMDSDIARMAFMKGETNIWNENSEGSWVNYFKKNVDLKENIVLKTLESKAPVDAYGLFFNLRHTKFQDRRVRKALVKAFNYDWINKMYYHSFRSRTDTIFGDTKYSHQEEISEDELKILKESNLELDEEFYQGKYTPPKYQTSAELRSGLLEAQKLLNEAGWEIDKKQDYKLVNKKTRKPFTIEFVISSDHIKRVVLYYASILEKKLGIEVTISNFDNAAYVNVLKNKNFDMVYFKLRGHDFPIIPNYFEALHSSSNRSGNVFNILGLNSEFVDSLLDNLSSASDDEKLTYFTRVLDRFFMFNYFIIPMGVNRKKFIAIDKKFTHPQLSDRDYNVVETWWMKK